VRKVDVAHGERRELGAASHGVERHGVDAATVQRHVVVAFVEGLARSRATTSSEYRIGPSRSSPVYGPRTYVLRGVHRDRTQARIPRADGVREGMLKVARRDISRHDSREIQAISRFPCRDSGRLSRPGGQQGRRASPARSLAHDGGVHVALSLPTSDASPCSFAGPSSPASATSDNASADKSITPTTGIIGPSSEERGA